jgi:hypothetical protein
LEGTLDLEISAALEPLRLWELLEMDMSLWGSGVECSGLELKCLQRPCALKGLSPGWC